MKEYSIVAILWDDHTAVTSQPLPKNPEDLICQVLTVGILVEQTDKCYVVASDLERYTDSDDLSYVIILKGTVSSIKEFGTIPIEIRRE